MLNTSTRRATPALLIVQAIVLLFACSCAATHVGPVFTLDDIAALRMNQTVDEVIAIMGETESTSRGVGWACERTGQDALDFPADRCTHLAYVSFEMGVGNNAPGTAASLAGVTTATTVKTTISDMQVLIIEFLDGRAFNITLNGETPPTASAALVDD